MLYIKWWASQNLNRNVIELVGVYDAGSEQIDVVQRIDLTLQRQDRNSAIHQPSLTLEQKSAQSLMQALWDSGVRPLETTDRTSEITALKAHIGFAEHVAKSMLSTTKP